MLIQFCKSKIAYATITQAELYYEGSITIDEQLLNAVNIVPGEKVDVLNVNTGTRIETYAIAGERDSGVICLNGPASHSGNVGDQVIVLSYAFLTPQEAEAYQTQIIHVDEHNKLKSRISAHS